MAVVAHCVPVNENRRSMARLTLPPHCSSICKFVASSVNPISFNCCSSVAYLSAAGLVSAGAPKPPPPIPYICMNYYIMAGFMPGIPPMPPMPPIPPAPPAPAPPAPPAPPPGMFIEPGMPPMAPMPGPAPPCIIYIAAFIFSGVIMARIISGLVSMARS